MGKLKFNVRKTSITILLIILAILIVLNLVSRSGLYDLTIFQPDTITFGGAVFLLSEIYFLSIVTRRKKATIGDILIGLIAVLAIIGVIVSRFGLTVGVFSTILGITDLGLLIGVGIELFRENKAR